MKIELKNQKMIMNINNYKLNYIKLEWKLTMKNIIIDKYHGLVIHCPIDCLVFGFKTLMQIDIRNIKKDLNNCKNKEDYIGEE